MYRQIALYLFLFFVVVISVGDPSRADQGNRFQPFVDPLPIPQKIKITALSSRHVVIKASQFAAKIHRDLPDTQVWGYNGSSPGPTFEVDSGVKIHVHWKSELPTKHLFKEPTGISMPHTGHMPDVRMVTHLHGAVVSEPDPLNKQKNNDGWPDAWITPGQEQEAEYPNKQTARTLWYHDHAIGETGRNVAAGLAGAYIIHDAYEKSLNLPSGDFDIPLLFQTRGINPDGSLYYSSDIGTEFYGNAMAVNGKLYPYLDVEPRKYRFRFVNTSNARLLALKLLEAPSLAVPGPAFYQIGSDSGFLENTIVLNDPADDEAPRLTLASAERADVIIDFSKYAGKTFLLHNAALPEGADHALPLPQMMLFKVGTKVNHPDTTQIPVHMAPIKRMKATDASVTRQIVLNQMDMGNNASMLQLNGKMWNDPITEKPLLGATEVWELINTLPDEHPFHIHLVQFQVLDRTPFDVDSYVKTGKVTFTGPPVPPDPNELGWKDTVRARVSMVTRIIMKFEPFAGYYVYHCHILEHEDMDMMRPFQVVAPPVDLIKH